jgi:hypothetical protein
VIGVTDAALAEIVGRAELALPAMTDAVVAALRAEIDVYRDGGLVPLSDLHRSVGDNLRYILDALRDPDAARDFAAPRETGRRRARQGVPLPEVIRAFRLCFSGLWNQLATEIRQIPDPDAVGTVLTAAAAIWQLTDEYALALTEAHRSTTADLIVARQQRRSALAEALFTGQPGPESWPWEAATLLGLPADADLVVVCAETAPGAGEGLPSIENRLAECGVASVWRLTPARQMGIVALGATPQDTVLEVLRAKARTRTGVSPVYRSLRDTPRALHLAGVAAASRPPGRPAVTVFAPSPLAGLVAQQQDESRRMAREVLGPVLELPAEDRDMLVSTLRAWFDSEGSAERTGATLYCHPNTVRYRLRRLQELTGRKLTNPWSVVELGAALQAVEMQRRDKPAR